MFSISIKQAIWTGVVVLFIGLLYWVDQNARESTLNQIETDNLKDQIVTRRKVDDAVNSAPTDADLVIEWLLKRQSK